MEDDSAAVLKKIMDEGIFDDLRKIVIAHLKKDVSLNQRVTIKQPILCYVDLYTSVNAESRNQNLC